jgi:hypothetical protein
MVVEVADMPELEPCWWTPDRVDQMVRRYQELSARAESPSAPSYQATGYQPAKGAKLDHHRITVIIADLDRAMLCLRAYGAQWTIVNYRTQGRTFAQIGEALSLSKQTCWEHYDKGIKRMAEYLGWRAVEG